MKCIIKENLIYSSEIPWGAYDMAIIKQEPMPKVSRAVRYQNPETNEEYLCLAGGFAWPGVKPGYAVVVAVLERTDDHGPTFKTVAEVEEFDVDTLLQKTWGLYLKYGLNCTSIPWAWYGDPGTGLQPFLDRFTRKLSDKGEEHPFFLTHPPQYREPDVFGAYTRTIYSLLRPERKRLILGDCTRLRAHLNELGNLAAATGKIEDYPAVSAFGYVVSALITYEPWMMDIIVPGMDTRLGMDTEDNLFGGYF